MGATPIDQARLRAAELGERPREVFRHLVDAFLTSGEPVGSRTLSQRLPVSLSPASIRNVMADLESLGLLYSPHTSAGRVPTERGLRLFVDGLLEVGELAPEERVSIETQVRAAGRGVEDVLTQATMMLSGLSRCAGLVVSTKQDPSIKHIEFVAVAPDKALVIIVGEDGQVENRLIATPLGLPVSALIEASNYVNARLRGRTLESARGEIMAELEGERALLDRLTAKIVAEGLATLTAPADAPRGSSEKVLIVRGASHLLDTVEAQADLERVRTLFDDIERKNDLIRLLELAASGDGVRIFIGSENRLFSLSGSSIVAAPYADAQGKIVGVVGILGPTRLNYGRIIPIVDHTAKVVGKLLALTHKDDAMNGDEQDYMPEEQAAADSAGDESAALQAEVADLKERLLRALAETDNIRKRAEREKTDASQYAVTRFARDVLSVADNLKRALDAYPPEARADASAQVKAVIEGVEATERHLQSTLERHGIKMIETDGARFDPNLHQAIAEVPAEGKPPGSIVNVVQTGYLIADRLLRPAMVTVARAGAPSGNAAESKT